MKAIHLLRFKLRKLLIKNKDRSIYVSGRRMGNTTRLIDLFIQDFFTEGEARIYDHYGTLEAHKRVMYLVLRRLHAEHGIKREDIHINKTSLVIRAFTEKEKPKLHGR